MNKRQHSGCPVNRDPFPTPNPRAERAARVQWLAVGGTSLSAHPGGLWRAQHHPGAAVSSQAEAQGHSSGCVACQSHQTAVLLFWRICKQLPVCPGVVLFFSSAAGGKETALDGSPQFSNFRQRESLGFSTRDSVTMVMGCVTLSKTMTPSPTSGEGMKAGAEVTMIWNPGWRCPWANTSGF